jgi:hypothetical protein
VSAVSRLQLPERIGWRDHGIGAALAVVYVAWLLTGARALGFPRDEGVYFRAGADYFRWWRLLWDHSGDALKQGVIDSAFGNNHEHPSLMKTLFGASEWFLHEKWHVFEDASTAFRLPGMASAGVMLWVTYLFGARAYGRRAGLVAATLLGLMPRVFFHAHLACFDVPMASMWILCIYVYWRAQDRPSHVGWMIAAGVVYGLALDTKHNAWFLPAVLVPHALWVFVSRALRERRIVIPGSLVAMAVLGPAVCVLLWPYLWHDTRARVEWWVNFHMHHDYYNIEFLGKNYFGPPSPKSDLPVMVLATVPGITLLLFVVGGVDRVRVALHRLRSWTLERLHFPPAAASRHDPRETDLLLALSIAMAIGPFLLSSTPIFGATKHWLPAYPALAIFAGRGFVLAAEAMRRALPGLTGRWWRAAQVALAASVTLGPLAITEHSHPFGLSTYVPVVGGTAGGADLGLNRQFWGYTTESAATEYLNAEASRHATVFIHDTTGDAWGRMQEEGRVRGDLRAGWSPGEAQYALVQHELHMNEVDYSIWVAYGTDAPVYIVEHDGVPIVSVYQRGFP